MGVRCHWGRAQTGCGAEELGQGAKTFWTMGLRAPSSAMTATMEGLAVVEIPQ